MSSICFHSLWQDDNDQLVIEMTHPGQLFFDNNYVDLLIAIKAATAFVMWIEIDFINKHVSVKSRYA